MLQMRASYWNNILLCIFQIVLNRAINGFQISMSNYLFEWIWQTFAFMYLYYVTRRARWVSNFRIVRAFRGPPESSPDYPLQKRVTQIASDFLNHIAFWGLADVLTILDKVRNTILYLTLHLYFIYMHLV